MSGNRRVSGNRCLSVTGSVTSSDGGELGGLGEGGGAALKKKKKKKKILTS